MTTDGNEDFDDISLTFWIVLWAVLAIVASLIYTKLKEKSLRKPSSYGSKQVEEQIARKLVNEISRQDNLVKPKTFRRQRSYEIIDGEVRIHYDIPFDEGTSQENKLKYTEDVIFAAEVESFPVQSDSTHMDEMELIFPGKLPRIVEEGEEFEDENDEVVKAKPFGCEETYAAEESRMESIPATEIIDEGQTDSIRDNDTESLSSENVTREEKLSKKYDGLPQHAEQIIATTEITNLESEKHSLFWQETQSPSLSIHEKLSSDELSSTSDEGVTETPNGVQILRSNNEIMPRHILNSTTGSVYRVTEVEGNESHTYTVTRRIVTKTKKTEENTTSRTLGESAECNEGQSSNICENTIGQNDISPHRGKPKNNVQASLFDNALVYSQPDKETTKKDTETANRTIKEKEFEAVGVFETKTDPSEWKLDEKAEIGVVKAQVARVVSQVGSVSDKESDGDCPTQLSCLEDGSDLLVDDSGDILFKVIGPSDEDFLVDFQTDKKSFAKDSPVDENENYCEPEPEVDLSKNWRSLPSWEEAHHIQHRELDRDADDSDAECPNEDEHHSDICSNMEMVKSDVNIFSTVTPNKHCLDSVQISGTPEPVISAIPASDDNTSQRENKIESTDNGGSDLQGYGVSQESIESSKVSEKKLDTHKETLLKPKAKVHHVTNFVNKQKNMIESKICEAKRQTVGSQIAKKDDTEGFTVGKVGNVEYKETNLSCESALSGSKLISNKKEVVVVNSSVNEDGENISPTVSNQVKDDKTLPDEEVIVTCTTESLVNNEVPVAVSISSENDQNENLTESGTVERTDVSPDKIGLSNEMSKETNLFTNVSLETNIKQEVSVESKITTDRSERTFHKDITSEVENQESDDEIIVAAYATEVAKDSEVILASPVAREEKLSFPSQTYSIANSVEVVPQENKPKPEATCLGSPQSPSTPVKVTYLKDISTERTVMKEATDVDCISDIDEIDIDNIELPEEGYKKSKSVTDLDEALASYGGIDYQVNTSITMQGNDENAMSKSVPDILQSCLKEDPKEVPTVSTSVENLPDMSLPNRNLSVSSPDFTKTPSSDEVKKITKIKIVHVKFLEMQEGISTENIEEDSFTVEGDRPISGKMKRRSGNFSPEFSPETSPTVENNEEVDGQPTILRGKETKEFEFGCHDLYSDVPSSPSSSVSAEIPKKPQNTVSSTRYPSREGTQEEGRHVAKYAVIQPQSLKPKHTESYSMKLTDKFQMNAASKPKRKPIPPGYQNESQLNTTTRTTQPTKTPPPCGYHKEMQSKHKNNNGKPPRSKQKSSGRMVTVKSGLINDYYECSSDADSETSYNDPSPRVRTRRMCRTMAHNEPDSASSSEPDSPRGSSGLSSRPGGFNAQDTRSPVNEQTLFSRFGHLGANQPSESSFNRLVASGMQQPGNRAVFDDSTASITSNRSVEFNPFADTEGYGNFEPYERSHSPTSISSDQSSVFSFNCDFDPVPAPGSAFNPEVYTCENPMCRRQDVLLGPEKTSYKSCPACFTYYCSSECRKLHWPAHKQNCYFGRVNTYVRSIIRLCQRRQDLSMYLSQLARDGYQKKRRGVVMATFSSPELAREFITKGHDAFSGRKPTYSSLVELNREGIISKHRVALMQAVRDYEPNEEFVFNIAVVAVNDIPISPAPRYKLNTVLHCIKMPLNEKIVARRRIEYNKVDSRLFALPKCSRHEFVNEMEARRHYCRNLSKNLRQYNIKLKEDYPECYKKLCMYVEHDISFEPMTVYGKRNYLTYKCIIAPEQKYALDPSYC